MGWPGAPSPDEEAEAGWQVATPPCTGPTHTGQLCLPRVGPAGWRGSLLLTRGLAAGQPGRRPGRGAYDVMLPQVSLKYKFNFPHQNGSVTLNTVSNTIPHSPQRLQPVARDRNLEVSLPPNRGFLSWAIQTFACQFTCQSRCDPGPGAWDSLTKQSSSGSDKRVGPRVPALPVCAPNLQVLVGTRPATYPPRSVSMRRSSASMLWLHHGNPPGPVLPPKVRPALRDPHRWTDPLFFDHSLPAAETRADSWAGSFVLNAHSLGCAPWTVLPRLPLLGLCSLGSCPTGLPLPGLCSLG